MNVLSMIVSALIAALCLPQQPDKFLTEPNHPVTIFEKTLSANKRLIVTCENLPLILTPKEKAEREQIVEESPGITFFNYLYAYSYIIVTKGGQRNVVWTRQQQTIGPIRPGKTDESPMSLEVYDVVFQDNILLVLGQRGRRTEVDIVRLNVGRNTAASRPGAKQTRTTASKEALESPLGPGRLVEKAGPGDGVIGGRILGPTVDGDVVVQLRHAVELKDGSPRITVYHLTHDAQDREFWTPDPANTYAPGEDPGILEFDASAHQP